MQQDGPGDARLEQGWEGLEQVQHFMPMQLQQAATLMPYPCMGL